MKARCENPNRRDYPDYGGRGIVVCDRWRESFVNFWSDMGNGYKAKLTIERRNNDGGYNAENCHWIPAAKQARNTRRSRFIKTMWGEITVAEASERTGLPAATIAWRIAHNWPPDLLVSQQVLPKNKSKPRRYIETPYGRLHLVEAARRAGIDESLLRYRLRKNWDVSRLFAPPKENHHG